MNGKNETFFQINSSWLYGSNSISSIQDENESLSFFDDYNKERYESKNFEISYIYESSIREKEEEKFMFNELPSAFHIGKLASGENFYNLADNNEANLEPFEQNINENKDSYISVIEKNNDESFLDSFIINSSEILINYYNNNNNEEEEIEQNFYNSISKNKLSKNKYKNCGFKISKNSNNYQTNSNNFNKINSLSSNTLINSVSFINLNKNKSNLSNAKMNLSSNSNLNGINSALLNIKRERESVTNSNKNIFSTTIIQKNKYKRKMHTKYMDDNINKKLKNLCIRFIIKCLNDELKKNNSVDYGGKKFANISNNTYSKNDYEALMKQTFKTILLGEASEEQTSEIISSRKASKKQDFKKTSSKKNIKENIGGNSNKILINKINTLYERNQEFSNIVEILNINYKDFWKRVSDIEEIKKINNNHNEINKKDKFLNEIVYR